MIVSGLFIIFILATVFQVVIWLGLFRPLALHTSDVLSNETPPVSVVICARNEAHNLEKNLPLWLAQQYPAAWEIIIVNDASSDDTSDILNRFAGENSRLKVFHLHEKNVEGKKHALNYGVRQAQFEWLLLTDADCQPASVQWLSGMAARFDTSVDIVAGHAPLFSAGNFPGLWSSYESTHTSMLMMSFAEAGFPYMGIGRNLAIRKNIRDQYEPHTHPSSLVSGDDDLMVNAAATAHNTRICLAPETFMYSKAPATWKIWLRQKRRQLAAGTKYKFFHQIALAAIGGSWAIHYGLGLILMLQGVNSGWILTAWLLRIIIVWTVQRRLLNLFGAKDLWLYVPFYDGLMAVYYGAVVPIMLATRPPGYWK